MLLFEESTQFWTWKVINKQIRHIWAVLMQHFEQKCNGSLDQPKSLHIHCCDLVAKNGIIHDGLSLAFQRWWYKKIQNNGCFFFVLYFTRSNVLYSPTLFSYISFTFPQTSKCFLSNGTKNMHFLASGPKLQAVRFGYVILGEKKKWGPILNVCSLVLYCSVVSTQWFVWQTLRPAGPGMDQSWRDIQ